jgi:hypothetical protein
VAIGAPRPLLHHNRTRPNFWTHNQAPDLDLNEIAAAQLAVDRKIEQRSVPQAAVSIEDDLRPKAVRPVLGRRCQNAAGPLATLKLTAASCSINVCFTRFATTDDGSLKWS